MSPRSSQVKKCETIIWKLTGAGGLRGATPCPGPGGVAGEITSYQGKEQRLQERIPHVQRKRNPSKMVNYIGTI